jgi:hypothetical protein
MGTLRLLDQESAGSEVDVGRLNYAASGRMQKRQRRYRMRGRQHNSNRRSALVVALGPKQARRRRRLSLAGLTALCKTTKLRGTHSRLIAASGAATAAASAVTFDHGRHGRERVGGDRQHERQNEQPANHQ